MSKVDIAEDKEDVSVPSSQPAIDNMIVPIPTPQNAEEKATPVPAKRHFKFCKLTKVNYRLAPKAGQSVLSVIEWPVAKKTTKGCSFAAPTPHQDLMKLSRKQFADETDSLGGQHVC